MKNTIGIKIKEIKGIVLLSNFIQASNDFLGLISEIDTVMSPTAKPTLNWKLKKLCYGSPATLEAESILLEDKNIADNSETIIKTIINGMYSLKTNNRRPSNFSDRALGLARNLAKSMVDDTTEIEIYSEDENVVYTSSAIKNIETILKPAREVYGVIEGKLERLNSHLNFNFYIYEPILNRRIRCTLMDADNKSLKDRIISFYEQQVMLTGLITTNINGEVVSAKITDIEGKNITHLIKDASEVMGIWDFTGEIDPVLFVRRGRDDN